MKIAILEIGDYHEGPDIIKVFSSVEKAAGNIPSGFKKKENMGYIWIDEINEKWLSIKEYEVEE